MSIVLCLCEPQCWGFEHATFNAGVLRMAQEAYPEASIRFMAEPGHIEEVRRALRRHGGEGTVLWEPIRIPERHLVHWKRLRAEHPWVRLVLARAQQTEAELLLLCSVTGEGLLTLKRGMNREEFRIPTLCIMHANLNTLLKRRSRWPLYWLLSLRTALDYPNPPSLRMVALGGPIYEAVTHLGLRKTDNWAVIDCPYLWPALAGDYAGETDEKVRFGYLGMAMKGFDLFARLADEVVPEFPRAEFHLVGFYSSWAGVRPDVRHIRGFGETPLSLEEFHRRARRLTYAVGTRSTDYYRLISSATFVDALAFVKPGIYLRNPYLEYYFDLMGDIGHLCKDYEELREVVRGILRDFPKERYRQQVVNILQGRHIFSAEHAALKLRTIVEQCQAEASA